MHTSLKWAETELRAPSLPPRSGGEGGAAPEGGAPGGGWCNCAQTPPTPRPSPPLASARGGRGAERPVVSLSRCVHALAPSRGRQLRGLRIWFGSALAAALLFSLPSPATAQPSVESFYKDQRVRMLVGYGVGTGNDLYLRL